MSLKDNIDMVKEELNSEEKFFEKAVVTERFVKKYKKPLIGSVIAIVLIVAADIAYDVNKQNTISAANETLKELQADSSNTATLARLQSLSPELHDVWAYSQAVAKESAEEFSKLTDSKALLIGDLSTYEAAQLKGDKKLLEKYAKQKDVIYKELALVELALIAMNEGKIDEAHANLSMISSDSPLANVAKSLMHYGVK
ncbi:hypothetical protein [Sulfurimonas microaerophilic]|uniref:hypothetical protein n=1 Tax=Sulfurimonas microaerophilic TaxID=3058392 RepID=UPI0027147DA0|nr:hypothetical protein [Sulfurimonas sp. hsl 1-7]